MANEEPRVRQNYLAILVAAVAYFLLQVGWFSMFMQPWLDGVGRTREWLMSTGLNPALQYGIALVTAALMAAAISCVTQLIGPQTVLRGAQVGALLWLGFVLTTFATEYAFEVRTFQLLAINTGCPFVGMVVEGAIVGGWKKKS